MILKQAVPSFKSSKALFVSVCRASYAKKKSLLKKKNRSNRGSSEMESAEGTTLIMGYHHILFRSSEKVPLVRTLEDGLEFHVAAGVRP